MANRKPQRSKTQIERDRRRIAEMYLRGELQADIAVELKLSQSTISNDLADLREEWKKAALMDFNDRKAQELAKVDNLEIEYWSAWKRSQQDAEIETVKRKGTLSKLDGVSTIPIEGTKRTEGQSGDPRFLQGIQWCINKRCEILGLDAPKKLEGTAAGGAFKVYNVIVKDDEE